MPGTRLKSDIKRKCDVYAKLDKVVWNEEKNDLEADSRKRSEK